MVVYAVAEPYLLQILLESLVVGGVLIPPIIVVDGLEGHSQGEVVAAILVPDNVASGLCGLAQVVDHSLLAGSKVFESGHFVAEHLNVRKTVHDVLKILVLYTMSRHGTGERRTYGQCRNSLFHKCIFKLILVFNLETSYST